MKYAIPVSVVMIGEIKVEADDFERAKEKAMEIAFDDPHDLDVNEASVANHVTEAMCIQS